MRIELIPSARRLIRSLRDIGYEFEDAVADIIDNSIEAQATSITVNLIFAGEESYLTIADNGIGMTSKQIQEALRFGSERNYLEEDLGRFGLGLKTASLSQCEKLTVSSRRGEERARINSYSWDLNHIEFYNKWEILKEDTNSLKDEVITHLHNTTGTVITWEKLGRLMGYKYPEGEYAKKQSINIIEGLKNHLGMIFHKFLSGEVKNKRISIYVNNEKVLPWDPYARGESETQIISSQIIPIEFNRKKFDIKIEPFILPPQSLFSSSKAHQNAGGPGKWNKQQGFYIYRAHRIIQAGGWSGLRTADEHTKLIRIALHVPPEVDELFKVNVAKKHASLPRDLKAKLIDIIIPIVLLGQNRYRENSSNSDVLNQNIIFNDKQTPKISFENILEPLSSHASIKNNILEIINDYVGLATVKDGFMLQKFIIKLIEKKKKSLTV